MSFDGLSACKICAGCARNWVDTEWMLGAALRAGYVPTDIEEEADYLVVNTCGFLKWVVSLLKSPLSVLNAYPAFPRSQKPLNLHIRLDASHIFTVSIRPLTLFLAAEFELLALHAY